MTEPTRCPYQDAGFPNREAYLNGVADRFGASPAAVRLLADLLGPSEDFDGLVTNVEDGMLYDLEDFEDETC